MILIDPGRFISAFKGTRVEMVSKGKRTKQITFSDDSIDKTLVQNK